MHAWRLVSPLVLTASSRPSKLGTGDLDPARSEVPRATAEYKYP